MAQVIAAAPFGDMCNSTVYGAPFVNAPKSPERGIRNPKIGKPKDEKRYLETLRNQLRTAEAEQSPGQNNPHLTRFDKQIKRQEIILEISELKDELAKKIQERNAAEAIAEDPQGTVGPLKLLDISINQINKEINVLQDELKKL